MNDTAYVSRLGLQKRDWPRCDNCGEVFNDGEEVRVLERYHNLIPKNVVHMRNCRGKDDGAQGLGTRADVESS